MTRSILLLTANPQDTDPLDLQKEVNIITDLLHEAQLSDQFTVHSALAITPTELRQALLRYQPEIVHFSGHGAGEQGIALLNDRDKTHLVTADALVDLFAEFQTVQCVILNACNSLVQASALIRHVPFAIGMNQPISDLAAIHFSSGFYQALGAGHSIESSFRLGCNAITLQNLKEASKPVLQRRFDQPLSYLASRNPQFVGRKAILQEVWDKLCFHPTVALSGLGGHGQDADRIGICTSPSS